ncbi:hypothetical protein [Lacihabitans soyangensis]|uniref:Uncharacterized protein n=1 Tax=Lacihabitans soyangensis TaxID=869394 RepID=A0AAE3H0L5_9BACT|nr:hypothetical protein [Lacihabitans soyangensis]MCP9762558.1 hypothetical protein [Lacihabitans soyangensis]
MRNLFLFCLLALVWSNISAQKINYSSDKKYQKIRLGVKYPTVTKKYENKESENVAIVQTPMISNKKRVYGTVIVKSKI